MKQQKFEGSGSDKRSELEYRINMEIVKDRNFLKKLKENPHKVLKEKFGVEIPAHIKILPHLEEPNSWHFVIRNVSVHPQELSSEDLEKIAGGDCWY